jgi:hypothetical protein
MSIFLCQKKEMKKQLLAFLLICSAFIQVSAQDNPYAIIRKPHNSDGYLLMSNDLSLSNNYIVRIFESIINPAGNDTLISKEKFTLLGKSYLKFPQSYLDKSGAHSYFFQISGYNNEGTLMYSSDFIPCTGGETTWLETDRYTCNGSDYAYSIVQSSPNNAPNYKYSLEEAFQYMSAEDNTAVPLYEYMYFSDFNAVLYNTPNVPAYAQYHGFGYEYGDGSLAPTASSVLGNHTYIFANQGETLPYDIYNSQNEQLFTSVDAIVAIQKGMGDWCCGPLLITNATTNNWSNYVPTSIVSLLGLFNNASDIDIEIGGERVYPDLTCNGDLSSGNIVSDPNGDVQNLNCIELLQSTTSWSADLQNYLNCIGIGNYNIRSITFSNWTNGYGISAGEFDFNKMIDSLGNYIPNSVSLNPGLYMITIKDRGIVKNLKFTEVTDSLEITVPISALVNINLFANPIVDGNYKIALNSAINTKLTYEVFDLNSNRISVEAVYLNSLSEGILNFTLPTMHQNKDLIHSFTFSDGSVYQIHSGH